MGCGMRAQRFPKSRSRTCATRNLVGRVWSTAHSNSGYHLGSHRQDFNGPDGDSRSPLIERPAGFFVFVREKSSPVDYYSPPWTINH